MLNLQVHCEASKWSEILFSTFWLPSWLVLFALVSLCFVHKQQSYWRWHQTNCIVAVSSVSVTEGTSGRTSSSCLLLSMGQLRRSKNIKSMIVFFHLIISKPRISNIDLCTTYNLQNFFTSKSKRFRVVLHVRHFFHGRSLALPRFPFLLAELGLRGCWAAIKNPVDSPLKNENSIVYYHMISYMMIIL